MGFDKDILISYAHIDDAPLVEGEKGWVTEFHRSLEIRLAQLLGKKPRIWRDPKLNGNDHFADEIMEQLEQIALLVSILSPRYVKSDWCVREVNTFYEASQRNLGDRINNKSRLFKVIKTPVNRQEHPAPLRDQLGYEFYRVDPDTGRAREFSKIFGIDNEQAFWQRLDDLAHDISEALGILQQTQSRVEAPDKNTEVIYLAETSHDLKEHRESILRELKAHGHRVLPDRNLPLVGSEYEQAVREQMTQCSLSIHLVGESYGLVPDGSNKSLPELQHDISVDLCHRHKLQRIVWITPGTEGNDERQLTFLRNLRNESRDLYAADLLETSIEEVKLAIHDKLTRISKPQPTDQQQAPATSTTGHSIFVICDQRDAGSEGLKKLEDYLFAKGMDVVLPVFEGEESEIRLDYQENLVACSAAIIFLGEANELWLRSKMRDFLKVAGYGRQEPLHHKAIYVAGPSTDMKTRIRSHDPVVIDAMNQFPQDALDQFLKTISSPVQA
ncbi:MAG: toll/interleukin-1 receptor domain-containing protein [Flavobacteriales bacterium]|nr:toll/interleukin-1 receptor domain-containing protein [Flavobacteriales bacterium]MCB9448318.1 toll/interleukin-1 receptor domain-containing protein [Flavobacteriales bacterium]